MRFALLTMAIALVAGRQAHALETDQYLLWGLELEDSAEAINAFLNSEMDVFLEKANASPRRYRTAERVAIGYYKHLFNNLLYTRTKKWLRESEEIDRFPDNSITMSEYQEMSIYRNRTFPFFLRLGRTVRVGDVYFGVDKFGHLFGFGRRYFRNYLRLVKAGHSKEDAMERTVLWGITQEQGFVGLLVDGIFSYADLEANFQGLLLLRDLSRGESPYLVNDGAGWRLRSPIDLREYVTPDFDESFNTNSYRFLRKHYVHRVYLKDYCEKRFLPEVQARFERYSHYGPSFSRQVIDAYLAGRRENVQELQSLEAICADLQVEPAVRSAQSPPTFKF